VNYSQENGFNLLSQRHDALNTSSDPALNQSLLNYPIQPPGFQGVRPKQGVAPDSYQSLNSGTDLSIQQRYGGNAQSLIQPY